MAAALRALARLGLALALLTGCGDGQQVLGVPVRLVVAPGDEDPFLGASQVTLRLEQAGRLRQELTVGLGEPGLLEPLDFGEGYVLRVEAVAGDLVLASGRSYPFAVTADGAVPSADVLVGRVGRFVTPVAGALDAPVAFVVPSSDGAVIVTEAGAFWRFVGHAEDAAPPGSATLEPVAERGELRGATWAAVGDLLIAVGGETGGAALVDLDGQILTSLTEPSLGSHAYGAALSPLAGEGALVLAGGSATPAGAATTAVTRLDVLGDVRGEISLEATSLDPLPRPRRGARGAAIVVHGATRPVVVVVGGESDGELEQTVIAFEAGDAQRRSSPLDVAAVHGAAISTGFTGRVILAGGAARDGASVSDVRVLQVYFDDGALTLALRGVPPPALYTARASARAVNLRPGLDLVIGGFDGGEAVETVEVVETGQEVFPGEVAPTGGLPRPFLAPRGVRLLDGTVLVADEGGVAQWVPSRE